MHTAGAAWIFTAFLTSPSAAPDQRRRSAGAQLRTADAGQPIAHFLPAGGRCRRGPGPPNAHNVRRGLVGDVRTVAECLTSLTACAIPFVMPPSLSKTARPASAPCRTPLQPSLPPSRASCPGRAAPGAGARWRGCHIALGTRAELWTGCDRRRRRAARGAGRKRAFGFPIRQERSVPCRFVPLLGQEGWAG
jgi:hypothetical protein